MPLLILILLNSFAMAEVILSEDNLESQFEGNPQVTSLKHRLEASEKLKGSLTRSFMPKVLLTYGRDRYSTGPYDHVNQPFGGIEAKINVFNSGKDVLENEKRSLGANAAQIDTNLMKVQVMAELRKALADYAYFEEVSGILKSSLENNDVNVKSARRRVSAGLATDTDILDFKQQEIMLNQEIAKLEYERGVVRRLVLILLGKDPQEAITINAFNLHPEHGGSEKLKSSQSGRSLIVRRSLLQADIARLEMKEAQRWWTPSVDIFGYALRFTQKEREYARPEQRNDAGIGFKVNFPIFDGGEGLRLSEARSHLVKSQESLAQAKLLEVGKISTDARRKLDLAHELIHGAEETVDVLTKYREGILQEYNRGIKNSPDVLQASQRWIQSKIQFAEIKRNYQVARAEVLYLKRLIE